VVNFSFQEYAIPPVRMMRHTTDRDGVWGIVRCLVASRSSAKEIWVTSSPSREGVGVSTVSGATPPGGMAEKVVTAERRMRTVAGSAVSTSRPEE